MLLIGAGGNPASGLGGGSGGVTVWYGAAQNVPNSLKIQVGFTGNTATIVQYLGTSGTPITLLQANTPSSSVSVAAFTANYFSASGFFTSVAGQAGTSGSNTASATTFLSGGSGTTGNTTTANYGYKTSGDGYFQLQPIIVGVGGTASGSGGIGCGAGSNGNAGGNGFALIASW